MKLLIVTPLYPPDIAGAAPYVKELATRLSKLHDITILAYGHIPEDIHGVTIIAVEKSSHLFVRLMHFTRALVRAMKRADIVYVENGPSVELPLIIARLIQRTKTMLHAYDETALHHATNSFWYRLIFSLARTFSHRTLVHTDSSTWITKLVQFTPNRVMDIPRPFARPEILPFATVTNEKQNAYEQSWVTHLEILTSLFKTIR